MKALLSAVILLSSLFAGAQQAQKCAAQAEGMAQIKYLLNNPGIQGHEFVAKATGYEVETSDNSAAVEVTIQGQNDDGDSWTEKYEIRLDLANCSFAQSTRK
jgi:hypothetical protein